MQLFQLLVCDLLRCKAAEQFVVSHVYRPFLFVVIHSDNYTTVLPSVKIC